MDAGLLAIKRPDQAKRRLAPSFSEEERVEIALAMARDAFDLCLAADFLGWSVVSDDQTVLAEARSLGFAVVEDEGAGLNEAIAVALRSLRTSGAGSVTVVPADIPSARPEDLEAILETGETSDVVIVPSSGGGTNALYVGPPDVIAPRFGERSLKAHIEAAEAVRARCSVLPIETMAVDLDTPQDVERFLRESAPRATRSYEVLSRLRPPEAAEA